MTSHIRPSRAFTLIELLVVISIISLLISILLPALASARDAARTIKCATGMRQITVAAMVYSEDFNGYLPLAYAYDPDKTGPIPATNTTWAQKLESYLSIPAGTLGGTPKLRTYGILDCPDIQPAVNRACSYAYNSYIGTLGPNPPFAEWRFAVKVVPKPVQTLLFGEMNASNDYLKVTAPDARNMEMRHHNNAGANIVMMDVHVSFIQSHPASDDPMWHW